MFKIQTLFPNSKNPFLSLEQISIDRNLAIAFYYYEKNEEYV